jgi:hypothetical protein
MCVLPQLWYAKLPHSRASESIAAQTKRPELSDMQEPNDMAPILAELIADVAEGLEARLGYVRAIKTAGGPYMASLVIVAERKLNEAAVEAIQRIINNQHMKPPAPS